MSVQAEIDGKLYQFETYSDLNAYVQQENSKAQPAPPPAPTPSPSPSPSPQPPTSVAPTPNAPVGASMGNRLRAPVNLSQSSIEPQQGPAVPLSPTTVSAKTILDKTPTNPMSVLRGVSSAITQAPGRIDNMVRSAVAGPTAEAIPNPQNPRQGNLIQATPGANMLRSALGETPVSPLQAAQGLRDVGGPNIVPLVESVDKNLPKPVADFINDTLTSPTAGILTLATSGTGPVVSKLGKPLPGLAEELNTFQRETKSISQKVAKKIEEIPITKSIEELTTGHWGTPSEVPNPGTKPIKLEVDELAKHGLHPIDLDAPDPIAPKAGEMSKIKMLASGFFEPVSTRLDKMGDAGKRMKQQIDLFRRIKAQRIGEGENFIEKTFKGLTDAELSNVTNVMLNDTQPINDRVSNVVKSLQTKMSEVVNEGLSKGMDIAPTSGKIISVKPGASYEVNGKSLINKAKKAIRVYVPEQGTYHFPRVATEGALEQFRSMGSIEEKAQALVKSQKFQNVDEARQYLLSLKDTLEGGRPTGRLEIASKNLLQDFHREPRVAMSKYFEDSYNRLAEIESFGLADKKITRLYGQIEAEFGPRGKEYAQDAFRSVIGDYALVGKGIKEGSQTLRDAQTISKMGLAQITNAGQTSNTFIRTNVKALYRGFKDFQTPEGQAFARAAGAYSDTIADDLGAGPQSWARKFLKGTGFSQTEYFNRGMAALAGKHYAEEQLGNLVKLQSKYGASDARVTKSFAARQLEELGIHPWEAVNRGNLTDRQLKNAAYKIVQQTQFTSHPEDLPLFWSSPEGKVLTQFKSFAVQHAKFIKHALYDEAKQGNIGPILRAVVASATMGELVNSTKEVVRSGFKKYPGQDLVEAVKHLQETGEITPLLDHELDNFAHIGALGIYTDAAQSAKMGKQGALQFLAGPTISDAAEILTPTAQGITSLIGTSIHGQGPDIKKLTESGTAVGKSILRKTPVVGNTMVKMLFNKTPKAKTPAKTKNKSPKGVSATRPTPGFEKKGIYG